MTTEEVDRAVTAIRRWTSLRPEVALVLGSGLGGLADDVEESVAIPYGDIPGFPVSTAPGHAGRLVVGTLRGRRVAAMAGRAHLYEGYSAEQVIFPLRVLARLGARALLVTNAAGGINERFTPGMLMVIRDHINLTGRNPLVGPNDPAIGPRFPDMSQVYDPGLRELALAVASRLSLDPVEGVYVSLLGPSYETPAEIRMLRSLGADAVGMSTVMEVIAANHMGMRVLGISCITNMAAGILPQKLTEEEVIETAAAVRSQFRALIEGVIEGLDETGAEDLDG